MQEIADILKYLNQTLEIICTTLANHFYVWVPHKLSKTKKKTFLDCISACSSLLKHKENMQFLKQIVMDDEKCTLYNNVGWKSLWDK